ncbi:hypothetical protein D3C85_1050750 [compost metagenome]
MHQRCQLEPLQMPDTQRLIRGHHHLDLFDRVAMDHRSALHSHLTEIGSCVHRFGIRPVATRLPEWLRGPASLQRIEIAASAGEAQKQMRHPLLMEAPRQLAALRVAQQGVDHRRGLQRRGK